MSHFVVDVEADGPAPGLYSMVSFGVVRVDRELQTTFYGETAPISERWIPDALAVSKFTREQHLAFESPEKTMQRFAVWLRETNLGNDRPIFFSDNVAFDWQFINYYSHAYLGDNPFGHSGRRIGDFYSGLRKNLRATRDWHRLRKTRHTHHPVDDAKGNAEALLAMCDKFGVELRV